MHRREYILLCVVCLLAGAGAAPAWGASPQPTDAELRSVAFAGEGVLGIENGSAFTDTGTATATANRTFFNESDPFAVSASVATSSDDRPVRMCVYERANGTETELACSAPLSADRSPEHVALHGLEWSNESVTTRQLAVVLRPASANGSVESPLAERTRPVAVFGRDDDEDGDGLTNEEELQRGLDPLVTDMDEDGLADGAEVNDYGTEPRDPDTDGDGVRDGEEIQTGTDPTDADTDGDGLDDRTELTIGTDPTNSRTVQYLLAGSLLGAVGVGCVAAVILALRRRVRSGSRVLGSIGTEADAAASPTMMTDGATKPTAHSPELLTDEDRVRHLLDRHGGRMKQSMIVEETEWSKAKVSRLLSAMADDGEIQKLPIGRENLIALDGHEFEVGSNRDDREEPVGRDV